MANPDPEPDQEPDHAPDAARRDDNDVVDSREVGRGGAVGPGEEEPEELSTGVGHEHGFPHAGLLAEARAEMVRVLRVSGMIRSDVLAHAVRTVDRDVFLPDTALELVYDPLLIHVTQRDGHGRTVSALAPAWLAARMLEQADLGPGMRVLEIGSGGYTAALAAHVIGATGSVTTIDIEPAVVDRTRSALRRLQLTDITVRHADATNLPTRAEPTHEDDADHPAQRRRDPLPAADALDGPFDRILVTAATDDIAPAWLDRLRVGGRLVAPLLLLRTTRSLALDWDGDRLTADDSCVCAVPPLRARTAHPAGQHGPQPGGEPGTDRSPAEWEGRGLDNDVYLRADPDTELDVAALRAALRVPGVRHWSGVEVGDWHDTDEYLPLAATQPDVGLLVATSDIPVDLGLVDPAARLGAPCVLERDSLAYRVMRRSQNRPGFHDLGVIAHGPHATRAAARLLSLLRHWSTRRHHQPHIELWPAGTPDHLLPAGKLIERPHHRVVVSWTGELP